jgi:hypothetical protein
MSLHQTESCNHRGELITAHSQAGMRSVVSGRWRDRLLSTLVVLLIGMLLLGTSAFGDGHLTDPEGYPLPEPDPGCVLGYDEDIKKVIQVCDPTQLNRWPDEKRWAVQNSPCEGHHYPRWRFVRAACAWHANAENLEACNWRHPFYTSPYVQGTIWLWEKHTEWERLQCLGGVLHGCIGWGAGWTSKKLVKWLGPKMWLAPKPACLELADVEWACERYATQEVCGESIPLIHHSCYTVPELQRR